jgi:DNA-directed RNA polymerase subunit RPC12/RpoP
MDGMTVLACDDCGMEFEIASAGFEDGKTVCPDCGSPNLSDVTPEDEDV